MKIAVFLLLKFTYVSASADEDETLRIVLHFVCIGPFFLGLGFIVLGEGQSLR